MIEAGYLKEGAPATGDELGRSIAQDSSALSASLKQSTQKHIDSTEGGEAKPFGTLTHEFASQAVDVTNTAATYTGKAAEAINQGAQYIGAQLSGAVASISQSVGATSANSEKSEARKTVEGVGEGLVSAGSGMGAGASSLYNSSTGAAQAEIQHNYGDDAASMSEKSGATARNVGQVGLDALGATSAMVHAVNIGKGAADEQSR